jgi:hypothetical protein
MEGTEIETRVRPSKPEPVQFSLASILLVITLTAAVFSSVLAGSDTVRVAAVSVLTVAVPMVLTVLLVYGRGYLRTFCIGALFPATLIVPLAFQGLDFFLYDSNRIGRLGRAGDQGELLAIAILIYGVVILWFGSVAVAIRWRLEAPPRESQLQTQPDWDDLPAEESQPRDVCE